MLKIPQIKESIVGFYCAAESMTCSALLDPRVPLLEVFPAPTLWMYNGALYNTTWFQWVMRDYIAKHALQDAGALIVFPSDVVHEQLLIVAGSTFDGDPAGVDQNSVEQYQLLHYDAVRHQSVWYYATMPQSELLKYKILVTKSGLYAVGCIPETIAFLMACRKQDIALFSTIIIDQHESPADLVSECKDTIIFSEQYANSYHAGVLRGMSLIGSALYEER